MQKCEVRAWDDAGVHVVRVSGEFDVGVCRLFHDASDRADAELVVVDLRGVTFLDSSAVGELITLQRRTDGHGARLAILRPEGMADLIFRLTGMDGNLPLYDDRVPVLANFNYG